MKQSIQKSKVLRAVPGQFLAAAVALAAALTVSTQAQADPGTGAVVTFIDRDHTGHTELISDDGQMRFDVYTHTPGNHVRLNPDGTFTLDSTGTQAPMTVSVPGSDGEWIVMWSGSGSFHITAIVEPAEDGEVDITGEAYHIHFQGQLTNLVDGSPWSLLGVAEVQDYQSKVLKIDLQPK
jgi:hypothetical protein